MERLPNDEECDKYDHLHPLSTIIEVEEFWLNSCDGMLLAVEKGDYEVIE